MGSVIVSWTGSCPDRDRRSDLNRRIEPIAILSQTYFEQAPPIRRYDQVLEGRVLISAGIFQDPPTSLPLVEGPADDPSPPFELRLSWPTEPQKLRLTEAFSTSKVSIQGTAFRLYDGRNFYPDENEISLVFATSDDHPELSGQVVAVHDRTECQASDNETVQQADWYLTRPSIHLRYYCEQWIDLLLGTIKFFYVPDLEYWRYEHNPNFGTLSEMLTENERPSLVEDAFDALAASFRREVETWGETATSVNAFWDAARGGDHPGSEAPPAERNDP